MHALVSTPSGPSAVGCYAAVNEGSAIKGHLCRPLRALFLCYRLIGRNRPPVIITQTMYSSALAMPAPFVGLAVTPQRPAHRATEV